MALAIEEITMLTTVQPADPLVDFGYVQKQFNRSKRTLYTWIGSGLLPAPRKLNGYNAWYLSEIEQAKERLLGDKASK